MGLREALAKKQALSLSIVAILVVVAVWSVIQQAWSHPPVPNTAYYTTDDGQHWFVDDIGRIPPFEHDGQQAVQAHVFDCDGNRFVGYLSRYTPAAKAILDKSKDELRQEAATQPSVVVGMMEHALRSVEYKVPGEPVWKRAKPKLTVKCKNGWDPAEIMPWGPLNGQP